MPFCIRYQEPGTMKRLTSTAKRDKKHPPRSIIKNITLEKFAKFVATRSLAEFPQKSILPHLPGGTSWYPRCLKNEDSSIIGQLSTISPSDSRANQASRHTLSFWNSAWVPRYSSRETTMSPSARISRMVAFRSGNCFVMNSPISALAWSLGVSMPWIKALLNATSRVWSPRRTPSL